MCDLAGNISVFQCPGRLPLCTTPLARVISRDTETQRYYLLSHTPAACSLTLGPDMEEITCAFLLLLAGLPALEASDPVDKDSPFYYDWESLQLGGLIFGGLLCIAGIAMALIPYLEKPLHSSFQALPIPAELNTGPSLEAGF